MPTPRATDVTTKYFIKGRRLAATSLRIFRMSRRAARAPLLGLQIRIAFRGGAQLDLNGSEILAKSFRFWAKANI
jgi:hypothetical protein